MADFKNLGKGLLTVPAVSLAADSFYANLGTTLSGFSGVVGGVLDKVKEFPGVNVLSDTAFYGAAGGLGALTLSNSILNKFQYMKDHKMLRYFLNSIAGVAAFTGGTAAAPYILGASLGYHLGSPVFNILHKSAGAVYGAVGGAAKGAFLGLVNGGRNGFNTPSWNPKIS